MEERNTEKINRIKDKRIWSSIASKLQNKDFEYELFDEGIYSI
jgi:hypothetical protein